MAVQTPQLVKINKKTGANTYTLYHPQTGTEFVLHDARNGVPWPSAEAAPTEYNADGTVATVDTDGGYYLLSDILKYITDVIDDFTEVLEFGGATTIQYLPVPSQGHPDEFKGVVYVVGDEHIYWRSSSSDAWSEFPPNTMFVNTGVTGADFISTQTDGTGTTRQGWYPLGGDNSVYPYRRDALSTISVAGGIMSLGYADGSSTTVSYASNVIPTDGTASSNKLVTEAAVYNFAATASKINTTATNGSGTYYITFVDGSGDGKTVYVDSATTPLSYNPSTNTINASISGSAGSVTQSFSVFGQSYNGSTAKTISKGDGLTLTPSGNTTTVSVGEGDGIVVSANSIAVKPGDGIAVDGTGVKINLESLNLFTQTYNGLNNVGVTHGAGLTYTVPSGSKTGTLSVLLNGDSLVTDASKGLSVNPGKGIIAAGNTGVAVKPSLGIQVTGDGVGIDLATNSGLELIAGDGIRVVADSSCGLTRSASGIGLTTTGVNTGTYSAIQVDQYGRATAGAQSIIFAAGPNDPDLADLVVGGLAFIGTSAAATSSYTGTAKSSGNISAMDDAE